MDQSSVPPAHRDGLRARRMITSGVAVALAAAALALPATSGVAHADDCPQGQVKNNRGNCVGGATSGGGWLNNHNESVLV